MKPMGRDHSEYDGWMAHRAAVSWTHDPSRDDAAERHFSMIPYAQIPDTE